ncbi:MAG: anaerobic ribonucleoside-triphosphate reductase activating protein [Bacteroidales bacterium]|jgi:anaerobic ribonucleoside-triphosphate reductase activating protein|nr:anaerobic ribonucleoside-triphosphate reductase activating protein [Bacteroidales bacterium]MDD2204057.1 anaerobic ribonucleoside-triphosphate reductase activating protein [Bacteroidales bacterium]MDD3151970.1 anaerobic ribonucleoside-triphosphate reductase activating protein [Bacteroidales bacterium]MDD3913355.1 anaerobic ribonucleoside-triphosphate reductase activating protein [Bacteroidales bacterium]MDD4633150.1 anaerobic ribonucleoside-triphosphate reductase activating protein [Bacteroi
MIKYYNYDIVFQEIPDEVTLAINITNCPNRCVGCHSPHLRENIGVELSCEMLHELLNKYNKTITCCCFMGGDTNVNELETLADYVHQHSSIKVAWYSGRNQLPPHFNLFQYVKLGEYIPEKGSLKSQNTNQRLYKNCNNVAVDITSLFWK